MSSSPKSVEPVNRSRESYFTAHLIERMTEPAEWIKFLNATNQLSDADFERAVHDSGYRLITLIQRGAAAQGDKPARTKKPVTGKATKNATVPMFSHEMIGERAYHISHSGEGGTDEENWHRAEAELRQGVWRGTQRFG